MERRNIHYMSQLAKDSSAKDIYDARIRVFSYFIDQLLSQAETNGYKLNVSFNIRVIERLADSKLPAHGRVKIRARLFNKTQTLDVVEIDESQMRRVFQILYEELCDMAGPVKTDKYCKTALVLVKKLPEAALYPPQRLM